MRADHLFIHGAFTLAVAIIGWFIRHLHNRTRRGNFISWLTAVLCVSGFASAGFVMLMLGWPPSKEYLGVACAGGGFGFLCGLAVGRFVWRYYSREIVGDEETP